MTSSTGAYVEQIINRPVSPEQDPKEKIVDAAHECLLDVVSHNRDFVTAVEITRAAADNSDDASYWDKQLHVLARMKGQAEEALLEHGTRTEERAGFNAAIEFALHTDDGLAFLRCWNDGNFEAIRREWPEAPEEVFNADTLHRASTDTSNVRPTARPAG